MPLSAPVELPPTAQWVDVALAEIDRQVNWLHYLSPVDNEAMWRAFAEDNYSRSPLLKYPPLAPQFVRMQQELQRLPVAQVEDPLLQALFLEKQKELALVIDLVRMRGTPGFVSLSLEIFGGAEPALVHTARHILATVPSEPELPDDAGCDEMLAAAQQELAHYRDRCARFKPQIHARADLNSHLLVQFGDLHISAGLQVPAARIAPLVAHEVGTHMVTYYNGAQQPLRQLATGLAHYDPLQEGLATLAEYLTGYLPPSRLRVLAARVVACDLAVHRRSIAQIFAVLHEEFGFAKHTAFDIAVRACRGGGLTKDCVYLRGLIDILAYLADGGELAPLFIGKFSFSQLSILQELTEREWLVPPALLPRHLTEPAAGERLLRARNLTVENLSQRTPE